MAHQCVWAHQLKIAARSHGPSVALYASLSQFLQVDVDQLDPRGRTPLHLATTLRHLECARILLRHGADVAKENRSGWTGLSHLDNHMFWFSLQATMGVVVILERWDINLSNE